MIKNPMKTILFKNFEQEFQDEFISVQITSLNFLEKDFVIDVTMLGGYIGSKTIEATGKAAVDNSKGSLYVVAQAYFVQNSIVTNDTMSIVKTDIENELKQLSLIQNITSMLKIVSRKSDSKSLIYDVLNRHTKYIIVQTIIIIISFSIAGFSIYFRWRKFNEKKNFPRQSSRVPNSSHGYFRSSHNYYRYIKNKYFSEISAGTLLFGTLLIIYKIEEGTLKMNTMVYKRSLTDKSVIEFILVVFVNFLIPICDIGLPMFIWYQYEVKDGFRMTYDYYWPVSAAFIFFGLAKFLFYTWNSFILYKTRVIYDLSR